MQRTRVLLGWGKGAIHPNTSNFRRSLRFDVVHRVRRLCEMGMLKERPKWLEWAERVPPMENHNLNLQVRKIRNPYPQMITFLLKKYPDMRFQDVYVDGNDWSVGNDTYRDDHPVMQFVARQLDFMNQGLSKKEAFRKTEEVFRERREYLEREQKVMMAMALNSGLSPMFSTGRAYLEAETAKAEAAHLQGIHRQLRQLKQAQEAVDATQATKGVAERRFDEQQILKDSDRLRRELVGDVSSLGAALPEDTETSDITSAAEQVSLSEELPLDAGTEAVQAVDRLFEDEKREAAAEAEEHEKPEVPFRAQPDAVPDIEESSAIRRRPEFVEAKAEDNVQVIMRRSQPQAEKRKKISAKGFDAMLRGGGSAVLGEDMQEDLQSDVATRRAKRERGSVLDDFEDDADDWRGGRRGGGRR